MNKKGGSGIAMSRDKMGKKQLGYCYLYDMVMWINDIYGEKYADYLITTDQQEASPSQPVSHHPVKVTEQHRR